MSILNQKVEELKGLVIESTCMNKDVKGEVFDVLLSENKGFSKERVVTLLIGLISDSLEIEGKLCELAYEDGYEHGSTLE